MVTDEQVEHALKILADREGEAAHTRAAHEYEKERLKVVKARLMASSLETSVSKQELFALNHDEYTGQLECIRVLAEANYHARDRRAAAAAMIDVWRTENATNRTFAKASQ
tara:strand:+ start:2979 stop:3311 length:333 start_codon:yes stop_codon:yes gene_type:complete